MRVRPIKTPGMMHFINSLDLTEPLITILLFIYILCSYESETLWCVILIISRYKIIAFTIK